MSASREKKQRQGAGGYSAKAARAQQEAAAYKRKAATYTSIGVVVVVLVAALLIWNSGFFQSQKIAATVGATEYKVNELSYYYQMQSSRSLYSMYGLLDTSKSDAEQMYDEAGTTYRDVFLEEAMDALTRVTAFYDKAMEAGYSESQVKDTVDATIADWKADAAASGYGYAAFLKANFGKYMTTGAFKDILTRAAVADAYYADLTDSFAYTEADYQAYYEENADSLDTFEYSQLYFEAAYETPKNEDGTDQELTDGEKARLQADAMAEAKEKADAALADLEAGKDIAALVEEYAPTNSDDHTISLGSAFSNLSFAEELYGYANGQSGTLEVEDTGCYVLVLHDRHLDETATRDSRHILIRAETSTDASGTAVAPTEGAWMDAKEKIDAILSQYQAGEQTAEAFAALAEEHSEDAGSNTNGGLYSGTAQGDFVSEYDQWLFDAARQTGDVEIIRHEAGENDGNPYWGYHLTYYVGENDPTWKLTSDSALRSDDTTAAVEELTATYTSTLGDGAEYLGN